jgi:hypothetical protein
MTSNDGMKLYRLFLAMNAPASYTSLLLKYIIMLKRGRCIPTVHWPLPPTSTFRTWIETSCQPFDRFEMFNLGCDSTVIEIAPKMAHDIPLTPSHDEGISHLTRR